MQARHIRDAERQGVRQQRTMSGPETGSSTRSWFSLFAQQPALIADLALAQRSQILRHLHRAGGNRAVERALVQRDAIEMEPITIYGHAGGTVEQNIPGLTHLRDTTGGSDVTLSRGQQAITRNAPVPTQRLPYDQTGRNWDAQAILRALGQYDRLGGTDSDAVRCVQAVAMASYIPRGPTAVAQYLASVLLDAMATQRMNDRRRTAMRVIRYVQDRITGGQATFGDLSWAQEAIHDLYYVDAEGTPEEEIGDQVVPTMANLLQTQTPVNTWCTLPAQVMEQARRLQPGEQLLTTTWRVLFNEAFEALEEQGIPV